MKNFIKKVFLTVTGRIVILFFIPILLTYILFSYIIHTTTTKTSITENGSELTNTIASTKIENIKNIIPFLKIPVSILRFYIYAKNDVHISHYDKEGITLLNTNVDGQYTRGIKIGESKKIFNQSLNMEELYKVSLEKSFEFQNYDTTKNGVPMPLDNSFYTIFIRPTLTSIFVALIAIVTLVYGVLILATSWLRFILIGSPLTEVLDEYQQKGI